ncbi:CO/xanthine dehydrogenase Mo-binding subunit [Luteibacter rhizovicinus]|uniref:CO/xanthine dehydrogenase Mo-binding subunit n=1 Tax=Luteibacter rhizovicinus TaxID=242606 RepID=A0A4V2W3U6_9GAMM|nr:molybdopterin cofactor-binding domain-containing protein [Luteibacter rhizovicinus]TCV93439.1 CO/xanthine dehydrogenase Mo-binding subunit [Luteibacter rhizovicinus]
MTRHDDRVDISRRAFIVNGALVVAFATMAPARLLAQKVDTLGTVILAPNLPGSLKSNPFLDAWIKIDDSGITVCTGKVELGTGVRTAMLQIAAEQLSVRPALITLVTADTARTPDEGYTAGSHSMADGGTALFNAAAQVRFLLLTAASSRLGVPVSRLTAKDGEIRADDGRKVTYAEAVKDIQLHRQADATSPAVDPKTFTLIGTSLPRVDIPGKVTGGAAYVQDMRLPGMLHARVVRPPLPGARLKQLDVTAVEKLPGVVRVVVDGDFIGVLADDEWRAIVAARALTRAAGWTAAPALPGYAGIHAALRTLPAKVYPTASRSTAPVSTKPAFTCTHTKQYVQHGSIGPSCAVAQLADGTMTVWTHTQGVYPLRGGLAEMLGVPLDKVHCIHVEGSGCYGHNGADDVAADAALLARAVPGQPVRVQWMRDQEQLWEPYGPAMATDLKATLDDAGNLRDWNFALWSTPHNERIVNAGRLAPATLLAKPFVSAPPVPIPNPEGDADRNAVPPYRIPNLDVTMNFVPEMPFRTSAMRSLGAHINVVSIETTVDELARSVGQDPVDFRIRHLDDPRAVEVIRTAAREFGWPYRGTDDRKAAGFAFSRYKNIMGYFAIAVEVAYDPDTNAVRLLRAVAAIDCGQIVNPDGARNQIEGGILQSTSWTLYEAVDFDEIQVHSNDWSGYPIMRFSQVPDEVSVHIVDRPGLPFLGAAEIAQGPTAAAVTIALSRVMGSPLRDLPLMRHAPFGRT